MTFNAPGFQLENFILDDNEEDKKQQMEEDIPTHESPLHQVLVPPHSTVDMPSSNTFVSPFSHIPHPPSHEIPQSSNPRLFEAISGFYRKFDQVSSKLAYIKSHFTTVDYRLETLEFAHKYDLNLE